MAIQWRASELPSSQYWKPVVVTVLMTRANAPPLLSPVSSTVSSTMGGAENGVGNEMLPPLTAPEATPASTCLPEMVKVPDSMASQLIPSAGALPQRNPTRLGARRSSLAQIAPLSSPVSSTVATTTGLAAKLAGKETVPLVNVPLETHPSGESPPSTSGPLR